MFTELTNNKETKPNVVYKKMNSTGSFYESMISACCGTFVSLLLFTPLDVIKIRLQSPEQQKTTIITPSTQPHYQSSSSSSSLLLSIKNNNNNNNNHHIRSYCKEIIFSKKKNDQNHSSSSLYNNNFTNSKKHKHASISSGPSLIQFSSTFDALFKIIRHEGPLSLYRGISASLFMAAPANAIYFFGYETLKGTQSDPRFQPFLAGAFARSISAICVAPIELLRTQMQGGFGNHKPNLIESCKLIINHTKKDGRRYLFRGLGPTLWRDVPFSAFYWTSYEKIRSKILQLQNNNNNMNFLDLYFLPKSSFGSAFCAGAISGALAAAFTTPFDVAKTRRQLNSTELPSMWSALNNILKTQGKSGLFRGIVPRIAKVSPTCAIMIGTYEYSKNLFRSI